MKTSSLLTALLALLSAGLGWWAVSQQQQLKALQQEIAALKSENKAIASAVPAAIAQPKQQTAKAELTQPTTAEVEPTAQPKEAKEDKKEKDPLRNATEQMAKMMKNPAMKDMIAMQSRTLIEGQYRDLLDELQLDEATRTKVLNLLSERMTTVQSEAMGLMDKNLKPEERKELIKKVGDSSQEVKNKLKEALGPEKYATFDRYEDSQAERQQITMLKGSLSSKEGLALSQEQEEKLMALMYTQRKSANYKHNYGDQYDLSPDKFKADALEDYQTKSKAMNESILKNAASFLAPDQLEALKKHQEQMKAMEKMALDMAGGVFGN